MPRPRTRRPWASSRSSSSRPPVSRCAAKPLQPAADRTGELAGGGRGRRVRAALGELQAVSIPGRGRPRRRRAGPGLAGPPRRPAARSPVPAAERQRARPRRRPSPRGGRVGRPRRARRRRLGLGASRPPSGPPSTPPTPRCWRPRSRSSAAGVSSARRPQAARGGPRRRAGPPRSARLRWLPRRGAQRRPRRDATRPARPPSASTSRPPSPSRPSSAAPRPAPSSGTCARSATACSAWPPSSCASIPATRSKPSSRAHRPGSSSLMAPLADALDAVGHPSRRHLPRDGRRSPSSTTHPAPGGRRGAGGARPEERRIELAAIEARAAALEGELAAAQTEVERSDEELQLARRSVDAFEGELTVRAGEDVQRMKRFAAAEQLRAQIDAVAAHAAAGPRRPPAQDLEAADQAVAAAESTFEQTASDISDLARRARKLAEELPIDNRPEGDPLRTLAELAESLQAHAEVLQPEIDKAAARGRQRVGAARGGAGRLPAGRRARRRTPARGPGRRPRASSWRGARRTSSWCSTSPSSASTRRCAPTCSRSSGRRPPIGSSCCSPRTPRCSGWAIELPVGGGHRRSGRCPPHEDPPVEPRAQPDARGGRCHCADRCRTAAATTDDSAAADVDITTPTTIDTDQEAAPTVRRWAGQR